MPLTSTSDLPPFVTSSANPLVREIYKVQNRIIGLKQETINFYFKVLLIHYQCPNCNGEIEMTSQSQCSCLCGNVFDPTLVFQKSNCCSAPLIRKTFHYACTHCQNTIPSRFLFDERLFDKAYFSEMMKESRSRAKKKKEQMIKYLNEARSDELQLLHEPCLESVPGLVDDLDCFIGVDEDESNHPEFEHHTGFGMQDYRSHILSALGCGNRLFSSIEGIGTDPREDKIWRFVTLIFMQHDQEVELTQCQDDLLIERL